MHLQIDMLENASYTQMQLSVALLRSAWEDILQQRRIMVAGRNSHMLDRRPDADAPEILTQEEVQRLATQKHMKGHSE